jgi:cellulose synthase/poly-beta-1,6-N-acetylglucosamine synthase-like glycosyltransferase
LSIYAQVFFLVTYLENRKKIIIRKGSIKLGYYPAVTIAVPCWNEEGTIYKTVRSLLDLNYPKDKLSIILIDDGSTDGTWSIIQKFAKYNNIKIFQKENGGKHTVLNLALEKMQTDFFGCLDADSFADPEALVRIMSYFEKDESIMAVTPSVNVYNPTNIIQNAQEAEYHMGIYFKKMLAFLGAINVTPGPLTIFRKKVFTDLGPYRHGHNTEDMEIAYRMQKNQYKIEHCNDAYVYTNTPKTIRTLYRQRLRWVYGFINNTLDYKSVLFRRKYGNFSLFTLPTGIVTVFSVSYVCGRMVFSLFNFLHQRIIQFQTIGFKLPNHIPNFDPFFINTKSILFLAILIYGLVIFSMMFGRKMSRGKWSFSLQMFYFFPIFTLLSPLWLFKAAYNTILSRKPAWR